MLKTFAFISRHKPTIEQAEIAFEKGIKLIPVGDRDAFNFDVKEFELFDGVVVVHAQAALRAFLAGMPVGVFENETRAKEGEKPTFLAKALHITEPTTN